jgi:hypothetical protein
MQSGLNGWLGGLQGEKIKDFGNLLLCSDEQIAEYTSSEM